MTDLLIVGPPGAGKGTQAHLLAQSADMVHISTGDMFREHVSNLTALGVEAKTYMDAGEYVPDELTGRMLTDRITTLSPDASLILDGFPRTLAQVHLLDNLLDRLDRRLDLVIVLDVPIEVAVERAAVRSSIEGRADDDATVVRRRHEVYAAQTAPLIELYRARTLARDVDGTRLVDDVATAIAGHVTTSASNELRDTTHGTFLASPGRVRSA